MFSSLPQRSHDNRNNSIAPPYSTCPKIGRGDIGDFSALPLHQLVYIVLCMNEGDCGLGENIGNISEQYKPTLLFMNQASFATLAQKMTKASTIKNNEII